MNIKRGCFLISIKLFKIPLALFPRSRFFFDNGWIFFFVVLSFSSSTELVIYTWKKFFAADDAHMIVSQDWISFAHCPYCLILVNIGKTSGQSLSNQTKGTLCKCLLNYQSRLSSIIIVSDRPQELVIVNRAIIGTRFMFSPATTIPKL